VSKTVVDSGGQCRIVGQLLWIAATASAFSAVSNGQPTPAYHAMYYRTVLTDPCLGAKWQLVFDATHPGRPPRMVPVKQEALQASASPTLLGQSFRSEEPDAFPPILLRAGDAVTIDQDSRFVHAEFQGVALESVAMGKSVRVRITLGSRRGEGAFQGTNEAVIVATATGPGRVLWVNGSAQTR
jgi:hypothetical protein